MVSDLLLRAYQQGKRVVSLKELRVERASKQWNFILQGKYINYDGSGCRSTVCLRLWSPCSKTCGLEESRDFGREGSSVEGEFCGCCSNHISNHGKIKLRWDKHL